MYNYVVLPSVCATWGYSLCPCQDVLLTGGRFARYRTSICTVGRLQQLVLRCERLHQKEEKTHDLEEKTCWMVRSHTHIMDRLKKDER